jgi:hypothetical protein
MSSDCAGLKRCGTASGGSLLKKVGQLVYWSAVVVIFAWAAWLRFRLPLDPIADPDLGRYLVPALKKIVGGAFTPSPYGHNFFYPGFVYVLLRAFGDFRAITVAQHILGLLAAGMLLLIWRRARVFVPRPRVDRASYDALGLLATVIFLLASESIHFEMRLRPEGLCAFLFSINLFFVIQFAACYFVERRRAATAVYGVIAVFTAMLLISLKPNFSLAAIVGLLPVGIFFFRRAWSWQKITLAGALAASAALLLLPDYFLSRKNEASQTYLPLMLFAIHADLIRDQMAADLERNAKVPYPRDWLVRIQRALSNEIVNSSVPIRPHHSLGFDYDYLMKNRNSIAAQLRREFHGDVSALCAFYWFYYRRIWLQRPLFVVKRIAREMAIFYAPKCPVYRLTKFLPLANEYDRGVKSLVEGAYPKIWMAYPPAVEFVARTEVLARTAPVIQQPVYIRKPEFILALTYLIMFLIAFGLGAAVLLREQQRRRLGWLAALVLFAHAYIMASCLEVAVIASLEVQRKVTVQMLPAILAQFLALWFVLEFALEIRARAKSSCSDTGSIYRSRPDVRCG